MSISSGNRDEATLLCRLLVAATLLLGSTGCAPVLAAQNVDSLAQALSSPRIQDRADAASALRHIAVQDWSGSARQALFNALVEEGKYAPETPVQSDQESSELRGEYQIDLVRLAVALQDPQSLEGMVWLGLQTDARAEDFVVSQGAAAIPYLEKAWAAGDSRRATILSVATRIGDSGRLLSNDLEQRILKLQLSASGFQWALTPEVLSHPEFVGLVRAVADTGADSFSRSTATAVLPGIQAAVTSLGPVTLWAREGEMLTFACDAQTPGPCTAARNLWSTVSSHLAGSRWQSAMNTIDAFTHELESACGQSAGAPMVCIALTANAANVRALIAARVRPAHH